MSKESVMAEYPDLSIGQSETVTPETTTETALWPGWRESGHHQPGWRRNHTAVKEDKILPMLLAFAEPPSPLAADGVEQLEKLLSEN